MARGWKKNKTPLLIATGGVLLVLSHAAAWHLGSVEKTNSTPHLPTPPSPKEADPTWTPAELLRRGREHEAAILAAEEAWRNQAEDPWQTRVEKARAELAADADVAALVRRGMAAAKHEREGPTAETAAAFGKWLELDPDAALDFLGRTSRDQIVSRLQGQVEHWLGQGNHTRLDELMKRFPMARTALLECAQGLCGERGADFLLDMARAMPDAEQRMELLCHSVDIEQWQGHLSKVARLLGPREAEYFVGVIAFRDDDRILLDEIRAAGFPAEAVAGIKARDAVQEEKPEPPAAETAKSAAEREAEVVAELERGLQPRAAAAFEGAGYRSLLPLRDLWPGYDHKLADLRDGRCTADDFLTELKAAWPGAAKMEGGLRVAVLENFFEQQPVAAVRWFSAASGGADWMDSVAPGIRCLNPEQMVPLVEEFPALLEDEGALANINILFHKWHDEDPARCRAALLRFPHAETRELLLGVFSADEGKGGGR